jgi:hypothetical protein
MEKKEPRKPFTGLLAEPLEPLRIGILADKKTIDQEVNERVALEFKKMVALLGHYSIESNVPDPWYLLALALAREVVPGFREKIKRGAPKKWGTLELSFLHAEIDSLLEEGLTIEQAAAKLAKEKSWKRFLSEKDGTAFGPDPAEALRRAYHMDCSQLWIDISKDARKYHAHIGDLEGWRQLMVKAAK